MIGFIQRKSGNNREIVNSTDDLKIQEHYVGMTSFSTKPIQIFPNPSQDFVEIFSEFPIQKIIVIDKTGQKLLETLDHNVDLTKYKVGTYFFKIQTENGSSLVRVVKQ